MQYKRRHADQNGKIERLYKTLLAQRCNNFISVIVQTHVTLTISANLCERMVRGIALLEIPSMCSNDHDESSHNSAGTIAMQLNRVANFATQNRYAI